MTKNEYLKYAIKNKLLDKLNWYFAVMSLPVDDYFENDYLIFDNGTYTVKLVGPNEVISDIGDDKVIYNSGTVINLDKKDLVNITKLTSTTFGLAVVNYMLLVNNFQNKIPYINEPVDVKAIEKLIVGLLDTEEISINDYIGFVDSCSFLTSFSRLVSVSATPKNILPPPGITKFKETVAKEMVIKYDSEWMNDPVLVKEFSDRLIEYDNEWLAGDPSLGKLVSGKVKGAGRGKTYLMYGTETGFGDNNKAILESLEDGWPMDSESLTTMYNASRAGSYDRGNETQKGGVTAKVVLRATNSVKIIPASNCNSGLGKEIIVTKTNKTYLVDRYIITGKKSILLLTKDNIDQYVNKIILLRSPLYCKLDKNNLCSVCVGKKLEEHKDGVPLLMTDISGAILSISLAAMHFKEVKTVKVDMKNIIT